MYFTLINKSYKNLLTKFTEMSGCAVIKENRILQGIYNKKLHLEIVCPGNLLRCY